MRRPALFVARDVPAVLLKAGSEHGVELRVEPAPGPPSPAYEVRPLGLFRIRFLGRRLGCGR